jgi:hypothetical protein
MPALVPGMNTEAEGGHGAIMTSGDTESKTRNPPGERGHSRAILRRRLHFWRPSASAADRSIDDPRGWKTAQKLLLR